MSMKVISNSPEQTEEIGEGWGRGAEAGLVISLIGDLGAGKTRLVKGIARGLGSPARVHSPTFSLINVYGGGRLLLAHLDLYRLETCEQIIAAGLDAFLPSPGVTVVEWAERWFGPEAPSKARSTGVERLLWARIEVLSENQRRIEFQDHTDP